MTDHPLLEILQQADLSDLQRQRLSGIVAEAFKQAIADRTPQNRPPGKAGLRAEKGYYRLLYLEDRLMHTTAAADAAGPPADRVLWEPLSETIGQMKDLPDLQTEILSAVHTALARISDPAQA
jgi:hypothetical protein